MERTLLLSKGGLFTNRICFNFLLPLVICHVGRNKRGFQSALLNSDSFPSILHKKYSKSATCDHSNIRGSSREITACMSESKQRIKVLIISGPTGVGKSALAEHLAKHHGPAELISADSVQVN
jgi:DNA replication protein DnaC